MNKKAIIILGGSFILIVAVLGVIIYLRSTATPENDLLVEDMPIADEPTLDIPDSETPIPVEPDGGIGDTPTTRGASKLTDEAVITPALFFQGNGIAYFSRTGQLFRTDMAVSGSTVLLSNKTELTVPAKSGINKILWPQVGSSYLTESGVGMAKQWSYYNPATGQYVDLPSQVKSVAWMPTGDKIMYVWVDGNGNATLNISNPDTSNYQTLSDLYDNDLAINISPDGTTVAFYRTQNTNLTENGIFTVTTDGKTWGTVTRDGYNKGTLWSPDSKKLLFTRKDPSTQRFNLWYANLATGQTQNLGVVTSETKAVWTRDSQSIVVAVPTSGVAGEGLTSDTIYKIDVATATKTEFSPGTGIDAQELFLSLDEDIVFFRNAQDGLLYYLFVQ